MSEKYRIEGVHETIIIEWAWQTALDRDEKELILGFANPITFDAAVKYLDTLTFTVTPVPDVPTAPMLGGDINWIYEAFSLGESYYLQTDPEKSLEYANKRGEILAKLRTQDGVVLTREQAKGDFCSWL